LFLRADFVEREKNIDVAVKLLFSVPKLDMMCNNN
jgi:hypothetical protein